MKMIIVIAAFLLLLTGIVFTRADIIIAGAICYIASLVIDLIQTIIDSKKFKKGIVAENKNKSTLAGITHLVQGLITLYGLVAIFIENPEVIKISGQIIWFGTIVGYALVGAFASLITGIPLTMTHGGWKVRYRNKKRKP